MNERAGVRGRQARRSPFAPYEDLARHVTVEGEARALDVDDERRALLPQPDGGAGDDTVASEAIQALVEGRQPA